MVKETTLLARQPIFDQQLNVIGYELLFRPENALDRTDLNHDGDRATYQVMLNAFSEIGMHNLIGNKKGFINYTRNNILSPPPVKDCELVVEVLEDITADPEVIESLTLLKQQGHSIALDDFIYHESLTPLIKLADIVKVDVLELSRKEVAEHVQILTEYDVELLAEKIEDQETFNYCKALGFHYFQGYFLSKPKLITDNKFPASAARLLQLLVDLQTENLTAEALQNLLSTESSLANHLVRVVNRMARHRVSTPDSVAGAILLVGVKQMQRCASFLALSSLEGKSTALQEQTVVRAKMCEFLGGRIAQQRSDQFFYLGLLSMLEAFLDLPSERIFQSAPFPKEYSAAILNHDGELGFVLKTCIAYERGDWGNIDWSSLKRHGVSIKDVKESYLEALAWSSETGADLIEAMHA